MFKLLNKISEKIKKLFEPKETQELISKEELELLKTPIISTDENYTTSELEEIVNELFPLFFAKSKEILEKNKGLNHVVFNMNLKSALTIKQERILYKILNKKAEESGCKNLFFYLPDANTPRLVFKNPLSIN